MLASMTTEQLEEWKIFDELDPPQSERLDWGLAHIVQVLMRDGKPLKEFMLAFGDEPSWRQPVVEQQTADYIEHQIDAWCQVTNAILTKKGIGANG